MSSSVQAPPVEQVDQAAGGGHHQVDAAAHPVDLPSDGDPAVDRGHGDAQRPAQRLQRRRPPGRPVPWSAPAPGRAGRRGGAGGAGRRQPAGRPAWSAPGRPKASVLPEPVWALPSTSRPVSASGSARAWIANGASIPCAARAATSRVGQAQRGERRRLRRRQRPARPSAPGQARTAPSRPDGCSAGDCYSGRCAGGQTGRRRPAGRRRTSRSCRHGRRFPVGPNRRNGPSCRAARHGRTGQRDPNRRHRRIAGRPAS